ncbi:MAG: hypothetical protein AB9836_06065 [Aminipila sp.]
MKLIVSGEGKQQFVEALEKLIPIENSMECIIVEVKVDTAIDPSKYISILGAMDKPVNCSILKY